MFLCSTSQCAVTGVKPACGRVAGVVSMCLHLCTAALQVMNMIKLFGKPIRVNKSSQNKQSLDVGA